MTKVITVYRKVSEIYIVKVHRALSQRISKNDETLIKMSIRNILIDFLGEERDAKEHKRMGKKEN